MDLSDFWQTDERGCAITRAEALDRRIDDVLDNHYDPFAALVEEIKSDARKSFSKSAILDLIEEYTA